MKTIIHYAFILDQSGSMELLKEAVISGFNEQVQSIAGLRKNNPDSEIKFTLCMFNDTAEFRFIDAHVDELKPLLPEDYNPDSCTALYDAIGATFNKINHQVEISDKVFIAIFTDGLENASTDFSSKDIRKLLQQAEENKWEVRFFCRQEDSIFYATEMGVSKKQMMNISMDRAGIHTMESKIYMCMSDLIGGK